MQPITRAQEHKQLFVSKVLRDLERIARIKMKGKNLNIVTEKNERIALLIREFSGTEKWIYAKKAGSIEKYGSILKRIKSEAINIMIRCQEVNEAGLSYRTSGAIIANIGVKYSNVFIGYAFDFTLQEIQRITYGTHEINIAWKFGDSARRYRWLDRY